MHSRYSLSYYFCDSKLSHSEYLSIKLEVTEFESVHYSSCFVGLENREEEVFNGT